MSRNALVRRLMIIERNEVGRLGRGALAERLMGPGWRVEVAGVDPPIRSDHDLVATVAAIDWELLDLVLVMVARDSLGWDCYDSLNAVRTAAREVGPEVPVIAAISDVHNPLLGIRALSSGASMVISSTEVEGSGRWVLTPERVGSIVAQPLSQSIRDTIGTDPAAVLEYVRQHGIEDAFEPGQGQAASSLSRRSVLRVRRDIAELGGIRPSLERYTGGMDRRIEIPTWREVVSYVNTARGVVDWGDDAWGNGLGPRIGHHGSIGVRDLEAATRLLVA